MRLFMLGIAATVGVVCLGTVFHSSKAARSVKAKVNALSENNFAEAPNTKAYAVGGSARPKYQQPSAATPVAEATPVATALARAESRVATVVPTLSTAKAQVQRVVDGFAAASQQPAAVTIAPPAPPPAVKLNKQTQQQLEDETRSLRQAKENRRHTDKAVAKKEEETRVKHAKQLLTEEVAAAKAKTEALARTATAKVVLQAQQTAERAKKAALFKQRICNFIYNYIYEFVCLCVFFYTYMYIYGYIYTSVPPSWNTPGRDLIWGNRA